MCGIFGLLSLGSRPTALDVTRLLRASKLLEHRGPDDEGFLLGSEDRLQAFAGSSTDRRIQLPSLERDTAEFYSVALGHRRLSIVDLSVGGHQPFCSTDARYALTFNGEIYNYIEVRAELEKLGDDFLTQTDTEVLLKALIRWNVSSLQKLVGMFSFVFLDFKEQRLLGARDFFGIKPFYYIRNPQHFCFASEIKALLELDKSPRRLNLQVASDFLNLGLNDHRAETFFENILELPPAHFIQMNWMQPHSFTIQRYWSPHPRQERRLNFGDAAEELQRLFFKSVSLHLRSDVPLGAALSGGMDSSSIVATMRALLPHHGLQAVSFVAKDARINEEKYVDLLADQANIRVHKTEPTSDEFNKDFDDLVFTQELPFRSSSIYAQYRVFRLAKDRGITVMLDGQGADELLGGYSMYFPAHLYDLLKRGQLVSALKFWQALKHLPQTNHLQILRSVAGFAKNSLHSSDSTSSRFRGSGLREFLIWSLLHSLPALLRYEDRNSMRFSIESRLPFLTPELVHFMYSISERFLISDSAETKAVFRRSMAKFVPDPIRLRRDKIGFETPEATWLLSEAASITALFESSVFRSFNGDYSKQVLRLWLNFKDTGQGYDPKIWRWISFIKWFERYHLSDEESLRELSEFA